MKRFLNNFISFNNLTSFFSAIGAIKLLIEIGIFFYPTYFIRFQNSWSFCLVLVVSFIFSVVKSWPKHKFEYIIKNRDVLITLKIGDCLRNKGAMIVSVNDEFDLDLNGNTLKTNSLLSGIMSKYYDSNPQKLQKVINKKLREKIYKDKLKNKKYPMGTVVEINHDDKTFYFVVNSVKNDSFHVSMSPESLGATLPNLWSFLSNNASKENNITIPLLGTGMGRTVLTREEVFREIVLTFITATTEKSFCNNLIVNILPQDVDKYKIDIESMNDFLRSQCIYSNFKKVTSTNVGIPLN